MLFSLLAVHTQPRLSGKGANSFFMPELKNFYFVKSSLTSISLTAVTYSIAALHISPCEHTYLGYFNSLLKQLSFLLSFFPYRKDCALFIMYAKKAESDNTIEKLNVF